MNFVEWHKAGPVLICGGVDTIIYLVNAASGQLLGSFFGHEMDIVSALFTRAEKGKKIVSISKDKTLRLWQPHPFDPNAIKLIRHTGAMPFHLEPL